MIQTINRIRLACLYAAATVIIISNVVNYFYCFKHLEDDYLQWRVAMLSIGISMFLMSVYIWLTESLKFKGFSIIVSGWIALFLLISFIGVCMGYNLHTKGFMMILFVTATFGIAHITTKAWQKWR